jgi:hypothetical protein
MPATCPTPVRNSPELPPLAEDDKLEVIYPFLFNDTDWDTPQH